VLWDLIPVRRVQVPDPGDERVVWLCLGQGVDHDHRDSLGEETVDPLVLPDVNFSIEVDLPWAASSIVAGRVVPSLESADAVCEDGVGCFDDVKSSGFVVDAVAASEGHLSVSSLEIVCVGWYRRVWRETVNKLKPLPGVG